MKTAEECLLQTMDDIYYEIYPSENKIPIYKKESLDGDFPLRIVKLAMEAYALQFAPKWVSVNERLPDSSGDYLVIVHNPKPTIHVIEFYNTDQSWGRYRSMVKFWMPLPALPLPHTNSLTHE